MSYRLPNGLEVILEANHTAPVVALQAWVGVGSADEPAALAGIAHVFEHMLFKGTKQRGVGQIAREVEAAGGDINAWTSYDETVYHLVLASQFFDVGLDILADALQNSTFDPGELERERQVVLEEIKQGLDDPDRVAAQALFQGAFGAHPYGRPIIGTVEAVRRLARADLQKFYAERYVASNVTLVVVGDFRAEAARERIAAAFCAMPQGEPSAARPAPPAADGLRISAVGRDVKEAQLLFGFRTPRVNHPDVPALDLLAVALGQGDSSRLNLEVVRNRQLATTTSSYVFSARDPGVLVVGASLPPGREAEAARVVLDEILRLGREEMSPAEHAKAMAILESDRIYDKETVQGYARKLGFFARIAGDVGFEAIYFERLHRLSAADLRRVAAQYMRVSNLALHAQLPDPRAERRQERSDRLAARLRTVAESAEARSDRRAARAQPPSGPPSPSAVAKHALPDGPTLLVLRDDSVPILAVRATWVGGLRYEDARSNGISNLIAALLTRGTKTRSAEQIAMEVESMAGSLSGYTGRNSLGVQAEFLSRHWERGLELIADCLLNAAFSAEEIEKERRIVLDDIRAQEDNLSQTALQVFHAAMWKRHPYRFDPLGTPASVAALGRRRILSHFRRLYGASDLTCAVVGDLDPDRVAAKVSSLFHADGGAEPAERPTVATEAPPDAPTLAIKPRAKEQAHLVLGFPGLTFADPDRFALEALAQVLSGQGGRLFAEIRERRGLAYRVSAFSMEGIEPGYFAVYVATSPENVDEALAAIRRELAEVVQSGVSAEELGRAQRYLVGTHAIGLQRKSAIAAALAFHEAYGQGWQAYREYGDRISAVQAVDVLRIARRILDPRREVTAVVKPKAAHPAAATRAAAARAVP